MKQNFFLGVFALFIAVFPYTAGAYYTTDQQAFTADGRMAVFTVDFAFGHSKHDVYIPILALNTASQSSEFLSYRLLNSDDAYAPGATAGIVLSDAPVKGNMYIVPKGVAKKFTLVVFYTPDVTEAGTKFRTHVTYLPFKFDGTQQLQLRPSELAYYMTPFVELVR